MSRQDIKVVWPDDYELTYPGETIKSVWNLIMELEQFDPGDKQPSHFELENGMKLKFNPYIFHSCYDEGRITNGELIEMLEMKESQPKLKTARRISGPAIQ